MGQPRQRSLRRNTSCAERPLYYAVIVAPRGGCSSRCGTAPCSLPSKSVATTFSPGGLQYDRAVRPSRHRHHGHTRASAPRTGRRVGCLRAAMGVAFDGRSQRRSGGRARRRWSAMCGRAHGAPPRGLRGLVPQRHRRRLRHSRPLPRLPSDCRAGGDGHRLEIQPDRRSPPDMIRADWAEGDGDGASARRRSRPRGGCSIWVQAANDQRLAFGWTKPRASVAEGASGGVVGENWSGIAASGAGPNEGGALRRPEEDPPAPGGSVHAPGISARAWPEPEPEPEPVRLPRTR